MPFTKYTNLDFDQIKTSIKDYLRANSNFTDFDFEGSNFSILIDTLAYNTYITAFNSNLIVNESFLDSATVRENVVSLARNIGYVPYSRKSSTASISFTANVGNSLTTTLTLKAGLVCVGSVSGSSYVFSIPENVTATVSNKIATFNNLNIKEGTFLKKTFTFDGSVNQKFILDNSFIDTESIRVHVDGNLYTLSDNIFKINSSSEIFLIQEVQDEKYELLFGDGIFGKKPVNGSEIVVTYITTDGKEGNGANSFSFAGSFEDDSKKSIPVTVNTITTNQSSQGGSNIESIESIKNFAPRLYSSQYRAVTPGDYETIIQSTVYPNAESVSVVGGEQLDPPQYGKVLISIKPKQGYYISDFDKQQIKNKLKRYSVSGIDVNIIDTKVLYVEVNSTVYYDATKNGNPNDLKTRVTNSLTKYSNSSEIRSFGGRFKYSKVLRAIDNTDTSITSNITTVRMRRDLKIQNNLFAQYEICFGNRFHVNPLGKNIKSTGFKISAEVETVYFTDTPNSDLKTGTISIVKHPRVIVNENGESETVTPIIIKSAGTVNYEKGEILINAIAINSTNIENDIIEIEAIPESNDVISLNDLYLSFDVSKSNINIIKDVIASGDDTSGAIFSSVDYYRSSYSNGDLTRS